MKPLIEEDAMSALKLAEGNISSAAALLGVRRDQLWDFMLRGTMLLIILENMREELLDKAEQLLRKAVREGKGWAVCFLLKTLGKERGYSTAPAGGAGLKNL